MFFALQKEGRKEFYMPMYLEHKPVLFGADFPWWRSRWNMEWEPECKIFIKFIMSKQRNIRKRRAVDDDEGVLDNAAHGDEPQRLTAEEIKLLQKQRHKRNVSNLLSVSCTPGRHRI